MKLSLITGRDWKKFLKNFKKPLDKLKISAII